MHDPAPPPQPAGAADGDAARPMTPFEFLTAGLRRRLETADPASVEGQLIAALRRSRVEVAEVRAELRRVQDLIPGLADVFELGPADLLDGATILAAVRRRVGDHMFRLRLPTEPALECCYRAGAREAEVAVVRDEGTGVDEVRVVVDEHADALLLAALLGRNVGPEALARFAGDEIVSISHTISGDGEGADTFEVRFSRRLVEEAVQ